MEKLVNKFNKNIKRIRDANTYFRKNKGTLKAQMELQNIVNKCNDICNELESKGFDLSQLDMNLT